MILIGNPNVLQKDRNWYAVLERLTKLRVMTGERFVLSSKFSTLASQEEDSSDLSEENKISNAVKALHLV